MLRLLLPLSNPPSNTYQEYVYVQGRSERWIIE